MIIVTGASRGLGAAIVKRLNSVGVETFGIARNFVKAQKLTLPCDVSDYSQVKAAATQIKKLNKPVEDLINAAGIASMNLAITTPSQTSQKILNTNLLGTIYCSQLFAPLMIRKKKGVIINFSTIAVALGLKGESVYIASKAGVEGFSRAFAREMSDFNIRVNCIAPGPIDTDLIKGIGKEQIKNIISRQIISKKFDPSNVCDLVEILLDSRSSSLSGQVLRVGGA